MRGGDSWERGEGRGLLGKGGGEGTRDGTRGGWGNGTVGKGMGLWGLRGKGCGEGTAEKGVSRRDCGERDEGREL